MEHERAADRRIWEGNVFWDNTYDVIKCVRKFIVANAAPSMLTGCLEHAFIHQIHNISINNIADRRDVNVL